MVVCGLLDTVGWHKIERPLIDIRYVRTFSHASPIISARVTKAVRYGAQGLGVPSACRSLGIVMTSNVCLGAIGGRPNTNDHSLYWGSFRADPPHILVDLTYRSAIINSHQPVTRSSRSTFGMLSHFIQAGSRCIPMAWAERTALQRHLVSV